MSKRIDDIVNELTNCIEEQIKTEVEMALGVMHRNDDECKTFRNAVCESLENNDSGSGLAYNITQFKCGSADCAVSMNFIGHWDDDEVNGK